MMPFITFALLALLQLSFATAHADVSNNTYFTHAEPDESGLTPSGNATHDGLRHDLRRQVEELGCNVAKNFQPNIFMECTEWCDQKDYGKNNILRYHV